MTMRTWMLAAALALALSADGPAAQSARPPKAPPVPVKQATKPPPKPAAKPADRAKVPEVSLGSAARRALLGGNVAAAKNGKTAQKPVVKKRS
jgi:hypothetical protein